MNNSLKLLFLLNIADISLTKHLTDLGAREINPIIGYLLSINFVWALLFKIAMSGAFIYAVVRLWGRIRQLRPMVTGLNVFFLVLVLYEIVGIAMLS